MSGVAACTIVSKNYLAFARVLAQSLREHHPELALYVLVVDRADGCFHAPDEPFEVLWHRRAPAGGPQAPAGFGQAPSALSRLAGPRPPRSARPSGCPSAGRAARRASGRGAAVTALYLASTLLVTPFQPGTSTAEASVLDLDVRQQGQVLLSALWSVVGFGALVVGLRRDLRLVRLGALVLLLVTVGKVFLFDLATLTSIYRVVSFIGLGLFLLTAAFLWQRMRPRALPDMREAADGIR